MKVHLDTDFGGDIDDLCALALLLNWPGVEVVGLTTVLEDEGQRAGYARYALDIAGHGAVPVAAGAEVRLARFREAEYGAPPEERYWPEPIAPAPGSLDLALDLLERSIEAGAIVVAIGPLTNLSLLEERSPGILRGATLCVMGGSVYRPPPEFPQWGHEMDFNLQTDVAASRHVLDACDPSRTTLVPLEASVQTALRRRDIEVLRRAGPLTALIARQAEAFAVDEGYEQRYGAPFAGLPNDLVNFQHDPLAVAVALGWEGASTDAVPVSMGVEGGWLRFRPAIDGRPLRVVTRLEPGEFESLWIDVVTRSGRHDQQVRADDSADQ